MTTRGDRLTRRRWMLRTAQARSAKALSIQGAIKRHRKCQAAGDVQLINRHTRYHYQNALRSEGCKKGTGERKEGKKTRKLAFVILKTHAS